MEDTNFGNVGIDVASVFYERSLENQRRMVNCAIKSAMASGKGVVKLSTCIYAKISDELKELGWQEDISDEEMYEDNNEGFSCLYPGCVDESTIFTNLSSDYDLISAEEFYKETLKVQRQDLWNALNYSMSNGISEVRLVYKAYPKLIDEMVKKGWEHIIWYADIKTKEECSMFYPICGFDEEVYNIQTSIREVIE